MRGPCERTDELSGSGSGPSIGSSWSEPCTAPGTSPPGLDLGR